MSTYRTHSVAALRVAWHGLDSLHKSTRVHLNPYLTLQCEVDFTVASAAQLVLFQYTD